MVSKLRRSQFEYLLLTSKLFIVQKTETEINAKRELGWSSKRMLDRVDVDYKTSATASVTRMGKNLPFCQNVKSRWQYFVG